MASKTKKPDEVAVLSETMLGALESRRQLGGDAYPPTLRELAELCDVPADDGRILKAIGKKTFKERAQVVGKPPLDSPVYFKGDVPSKADLEKRRIAALAAR